MSYFCIFYFNIIFKHRCALKTDLLLLENQARTLVLATIQTATDMLEIFLWAEEESGRYAKKKEQLGMCEKAWRRTGIKQRVASMRKDKLCFVLCYFILH